MFKECSDLKKQKIKDSLQKTKDKRQNQNCKVYEIKFDKSHLSIEKKNYLNRLFLEGKWLYNSILSSDDIFNYDTKIKEVSIINKNKELEKRDLITISSQMKQSIYKRILSSIKGLSTKKKKGSFKEVGKLKFKSQLNSIPLKQFNNTYKIENNNYIKIQGFNKHFKVIGLYQIPINADISNANLIRKNGNYYLKITCFLDKENRVRKNNAIGLDFGIKDGIIDSTGNKYNFNYPESSKLKKISKKFNKSIKGSKNRYKLKNKLNKEYENISNKKKDCKNKFVSKLKKEYDYICIQNENIKGWKSSKMKGWGRRIHHSILGGIISELKKYSGTLIVDRYFPSTQLCPLCGRKNKKSLEERVYYCDCGYSQDRDVHSAINILSEGLKQISMEHRNTMLVEKQTSVKFSINGNLVSYTSMKQEAQLL